jgi:hypothetical protein
LANFKASDGDGLAPEQEQAAVNHQSISMVGFAVEPGASRQSRRFVTTYASINLR